MDMSVEKGGIARIPDCLEHTNCYTATKESKRNPMVALSIPYKIIRVVLHRHPVPSDIIDLMMDYYIEFKLRVKTNNL